MSKSPLGYTEASNATPPAGGGSRPDSNASTEPSESTGTSVATERFGHTDQMKDHRILVVDDEPASRRGLQELLTVWGYDVTAAGDGQGALERAAVRAPDLVIADLVMHGRDALHRRRERHRQGAGRPHGPRALTAPERAVRRGQLRGHSGNPAGERDLRARAGLVHRRRGAASGLLRARGRRDAVPGRGR